MAKTDNTTTAAPRIRKSPAEKAQAQLDTAQKRYDKAVAKQAKVHAGVEAANVEVSEAQRFLDFAMGNRNLPDLDVPADDSPAEPIQSEELFSANA